MKTYIKLALVAAAAMSVFASCKDEEVFDTSVTRHLEMTKDGEPWNIYYGTSNMPLYIYKTDGEFVANYSTSYRFSLPNDDYRVFATTESKLINPPANLDTEIIPQDPEAKQTFAISDVVTYTAGTDLKLDLFTRTGQLRLKALDTKADKSYSIVRAVVTTPVIGYNIAKGGPEVGEPITLERYKATAGGGVGYSEDLYLMGSTEDKVNVYIEYLDNDSNVVNTKPFAESFVVEPNKLTEVGFELNNPNEPVIINYTVTIGQLNWRNNDIFPSVKVEVPDGFTYVAPGEDLGAIVKAQMADDDVAEINLFLKAGTEYSIGDKVLESITKPFTLRGQTPGFGQNRASVKLVNISVEGNIDHIAFENVQLVPSKDRLFNIARQEFHVGEIAMRNVAIDNWNGTIWYSNVSTDNTQTVDRVVMENCRLTNLTVGSNALWTINSRRIAPMPSWTFSGCLFHGKNFGTKNVILTGLSKTPGAVSVKVDGCTFIDPRGSDCTYFDIDPAAASSATLTVTGCTVAGSQGGVGTWFKLTGNITTTATGNTRAKGYTMKAYGIAEPAEGTATYTDILSQFNL